MRNMTCVLRGPAWSGALSRSADPWGSARSDAPAANDDAQSTQSSKRSPGLFERIDRWFWRQSQRERERYLARSRDVFELEERIRRLERSTGSRYY